ncbi:MAG TPA: hypothetical protein VFV53_01450 [Candidatus Limnocylindrales bacterium]|nr:hypothetical protein [Candidatus Limnocylindrales bacterium]
MNQREVSTRRWLAAMLSGLIVWFVAMNALWPVFANGPLNTWAGPFVAVVPAIVAAGLVVGARTARRWIAIAVLTTGLIVAAMAALLFAFLQSGL